MVLSLFSSIWKNKRQHRPFWFFGLVCVGCLGVLLLRQLQAAPRPSAPTRLDPKASCVDANCHTAQHQFKFIHRKKDRELCRDCHQPIRPDRHRFQPTSKSQDACVRCHKTFASEHPKRKAWTFVHGPVAVGDCLACHNPHGSNHRFLLSQPEGQSCLTCHRDISHPKPPHPGLHKPVSQGKCLTCHAAHGSSAQHMLRPKTVENCLECHKEVKEKLSKTRAHHGAMIQGKQCLNCHTGHAVEQKYMLVRRGAKLCLGCHNQSVVTHGKKKLTNMVQHLKQHKIHHDPVKKGKCTACHQAHGSLHPKLLAKHLPASLYATFSSSQYALCFSCHQPDLATAKQTYIDTGFRNGALNLHAIHIQQKKGRSCRFCHDMHASSLPHLIRKTVRFGQWDLPIGFQKQTDGGLCQTACHEPKQYNRKRPVLQGYESYRKLLVAPGLPQHPKPRFRTQ